MFKATLPEIPRIITALAQWMGVLLAASTLEKRRSKKLTILEMMVSGVLIIGWNYVMVTYFQRTTPEWILDVALSVLLMILWIWLICRIDMITAIGYGVMGFVLGEFLASTEWLFSYWLTGTDILLSGLGISLFSLFFTVVPIFFYYMEKKVQTSQLKKIQVVLFFFIALLAMVVGNLGFYRVDYQSILEINAGEMLSVMRTLVDFGAVTVLFFLQKSWQEESTEQELTAINHMLNLQYKQYLDYKMNTEYISRQCHDLKHQINALRSACTQEERESYLTELEAAIQQYDAQKVTGNAVLDSILTQKQMQCAQKGIQFICNADGRMLKNLAVRDISNLFGNIIDNAMECVAKYNDEEDRIIQGAVYQKNQFLIIRFENCCYEKLQFEKGIPVTTKEDKTKHGYGMSSILYTVKKYDGNVQIHCTDGWFIIKILIPIM